jgi:TIR domain
MSTDIFLSYASEDTSKAVELARILENDGWSVWWDREISPGQDFEVEIDMALSQARAVVVLWSEFSVASNWVRNEAREAKEANKLIPVVLDDARIPLSYRSLNTIDLRQWPDKQSLLEISMFKSAVSRVLHNGVSGQMLKKPVTTEEMTLSVRVASRVADMVAGKKSNAAQLMAQDSSLAIERCITDILLDILNTPPDAVESKIDAYIMQLANVFRAPTVVCSQVNFSRMSVSAMRSMSYSKVTAAQENTILDYVNQYCSPSGEHNLRLSPGAWPEGKMLCLPLSQYADDREFAWFISEAPIAEWTLRTQERLLKLASGLQALVSRGPATR